MFIHERSKSPGDVDDKGYTDEPEEVTEDSLIYLNKDHCTLLERGERENDDGSGCRKDHEIEYGQEIAHENESC